MATTPNLTVTSTTPAASVEDDLSALEAQFGPFESIEPDRARYTAELAELPVLGLLTLARQAAPSTAA